MELLNLEPGNIQLVSPSRMEAMMTGTFYATISKKYLVTLLYEDYSKESYRSNREELSNLTGGYLGLVELVQSHREVVGS